MNSFAIFGASGHGKVLAELAELNGYAAVFYDDNYVSIKNVHHWPVVGGLQDLIEANMPSIVAVGDNHIRKRIFQKLEANGVELQTLIHPSACISQYALIGVGTAIMANCVVNPFATIGKACIINSSAIIEHDCKLSNYIHVSPNTALAGKVSIGELTWIGLGSSIKQCVAIGNECTIGAGSVVISNIPNNSLGYGVPLKINQRADK